MPRASGKSRRALAAAGAAVVASAVVGVGAAAADTFTYTGGEQTYAVPARITGLHVVLVGASGASETVPDLSAAGGHGARLTADVPVPAGTTTLYVEVGGTGTNANPPSVAYTATGGFNGGGNGPFGGGGASDIRTVSSGQQDSLNSRLAVAGGGGGAGGNVDYSANGGDAGNADGSGNPGVGIISGSGATSMTPGQAADQPTVTSYCQNTGGVDGERGDAGASGAGGNSAFVFISGTPISGGGGGGINGGGGGAQCYTSPGAAATQYAGAGGAGSSGAPSGQNVKITTDTSDPAEVVLTTPVPVNTAPPTLNGGLTVGDVLAESHGIWSSSLAVSGYAYQWERCDAGGGSCTAISGATGQTYGLSAEDVGHTLRVQETASNFYGPASTPVTSAPSGVVLGQAPTTIDPPTITGAATPRQLLIATHAPWSGGPITGYADQWERCDASGGSCQPINGAVDQTYTVAAADIGSTLRVQETATNAYGRSAPAASAPTAIVQPPMTSTLAPHPRLLRTRFDGAAVLVTLACASGGSACKGSITLRHRETVISKRLGRKHGRQLAIVLGRASYSISPGRSRPIKVWLNRAGKRLLKRLHQLATNDTVTLHRATGNSTTVISFKLTLTQTKKHHR
jgi:hypothetical protein